jgi:hypothetical protein
MREGERNYKAALDDPKMEAADEFFILKSPRMIFSSSATTWTSISSPARF